MNGCGGRRTSVGPMGAPVSTTRTTVAPRKVRVLSFAAICAGGALGALIGWAFIRLQVDGDTAVPEALGALVGGVVAALGIAVVVTLVLRAMTEWRSIQQGVNPRTGERLRRPG